MADLFPGMIAQTGDIAYYYGWLLQWPIAWHSAAPQWKDESLTSMDGRFFKSNGELQGTSVPKRQPTSLGGQGRAFGVVSGMWRDGVTDPQYDATGLFMVDGGPTAAKAEVVSNASTTGIEHALILLHRDHAPVGSNLRARGSYYAYLHLAYQSPDGLDYRIALEWGQPIRVDLTTDSGQTWKQVALASDLGDSNGYLKSNRQEFRLKVTPNKDDVRLELEIGDGHFLRTSPGPLPKQGNIRLVSKGGSLRFWYYPLRYQPISLTKSPKDFQVPLQNLNLGLVSINGQTKTPVDQTITPTITSPDGRSLAVSVIAQRPDAGDGQGSDTPARLSDFTVYVPPVFTNSVPGGSPLPGTTNLRVLRVEQMDVFDAVTRQASFAANLACSNQGGVYNGAYGRYALSLDASNGGPFARQATGICGSGGGIRFFRQDPVNLMFVPFQDKSEMMQRPLGQEVDFDGWAWPAVARFCANAGNIADDFLQTIPYWPPGIASADCPYYTLGRGVGSTPRYRYYPTQPVWSILAEIVMQLAVIDPATGQPAPFYMGFDAWGQFHFEPVSFVSKSPSAFYSTNAGRTGGVPIERLEVFNSVADMRSSVDLFGLDANTFELLYLHLPMPPDVLRAVGYTMPLVQRSPTFISQQYMQDVGQAVQFQASLVQQTLRMRVPFIPTVGAGATCDVWAEEIGGVARYEIERAYSAYGIQDVSGQSGLNDCYSIVDCRAVINTI